MFSSTLNVRMMMILQLTYSGTLMVSIKWNLSKVPFHLKNVNEVVESVLNIVGLFDRVHHVVFKESVL